MAHSTCRCIGRAIMITRKGASVMNSGAARGVPLSINW